MESNHAACVMIRQAAGMVPNPAAAPARPQVRHDLPNRSANTESAPPTGKPVNMLIDLPGNL